VPGRSNTILPFLLIFLVILALVGLTWACYNFANQFPSGKDFTTGWTAAKLWLDKNTSPYVTGFPQEVQRLTGQAPAPFIYPFAAVLIFTPLAGFEFALAHAVWMAVGILMVVVFVGLGLSISGWQLSPLELALVTIFSLFWYNGVRTIMLGQFVAITGVIVLGSIWLIQHKQDGGAGFLLAFALIRPDLTLILAIFTVIWSLSYRRYQVIVGLLAGMGFIGAISLLLMPAWSLQWLQILAGTTGRSDWYGSAISLVASMIPGLRPWLSIVLNGFVVIYMAVVWLRLHSGDDRPFLWASMLTLAITTLVGFRVDSTNAILLLPALFLIFRIWKERWGLPGQIASWLLLAAAAGFSWLGVIPVIGQKVGLEPASLFILLPFITLIGLFWVRWWAIRAARLPFEILRDRIGN
jgi:hypothetical protein